MRLETAPRPDYALRVNTRLVASNTILHYSSDEMEHVLKQEQEENIFFTVKERAICLRCGTHLHGPYCPACGIKVLEMSQTALLQPCSESYNQQTELYEQYHRINGSSPDDDTYSLFATLPFRETFANILLQQLALIINYDDRPIAEQLVGNLNEHGYLDVSVDEIADWLRMPVERVEHVLCQLQSLDPPGIGARSLRECLLLQIERLRDELSSRPLMRLIVEQHLEQLGRSQFRELATLLHVPERDIQQAKQSIRTVLHPFPTSVYQADEYFLWGEQSTSYIRPDVIIRKEGAVLVVELIEELRYTFCIEGPAFSDASAANSTVKQTELAAYVHTYSDRTRHFVASVQRRWHLLKYITEAIVRAQQAFLEKKTSYLSPLTQTALAGQLGLDESTVSRALASKYALLPDGRLMPLSNFFDNSQEPKKYLREIIEQEHPDHRMSDEELASLLTSRGIPVARRTVTKYRKSLGIGSVHERKQRAHPAHLIDMK